MEDINKYLARRISHVTKRINSIKESYGDHPSQTHTYHGGWDLGYWEGLLSAYENVRDRMDELTVKENIKNEL